MKIIETKAYPIDEHPNPEAVFDWIRNNWHDLCDFVLQEATDSAKALAAAVGATLDYSISITPDCGEFIDFKLEYGDGRTTGDAGLDLDGECPLTGVYYDEFLLDAFRAGKSTDALTNILQAAGVNLLSAIHEECDYRYSNQALQEDCEMNDWHFKECGEFVAC